MSAADRIMMLLAIIAHDLSAVASITDRGYDIRQEKGELVAQVGRRRFEITVRELEGEGET